MNEIVQRDNVLIKDEQYLALIEEISAAAIETRHTAAMTLLEGNHAIGRSIVEYTNYTENKPTHVVREIAKDLKYSERNVWNIYRISQRYETMDSLIHAMEEHGWEGKTPTFTAAVRVLLNEGKTTDPTLDLTGAAKRLIKRYGLEDAKVIAQEVLSYE